MVCRHGQNPRQLYLLQGCEPLSARKAPLPKNEGQRIKVLWQYDVLDSVPEKEFDELADLARLICGAPVALISLVDEDRQWFKSKLGVNVSETSRDVSLCAHAILQKDLLIVPDATKDKRFKNNPLVTNRAQDPFLRRRSVDLPVRPRVGHAVRHRQGGAQTDRRSKARAENPCPPRDVPSLNFVTARASWPRPRLKSSG